MMLNIYLFRLLFIHQSIYLFIFACFYSFSLSRFTHVSLLVFLIHCIHFVLFKDVFKNCTSHSIKMT